MSRASALLSGLAALLLVIVVGNPPVNEAIFDQLSLGATGLGLTGQATSFLSWDVFDDFGDRGPAAIVRSVLFVVLAAVLGGIVGRSPKLPALIGGWGAGMIAAIVASVGYALVIDPQLAFPTPDPSFTDRLSFGAQAGAIAGVLPSLAIVVAVAIGARPKVTPVAATTPAPGAWVPAPTPQPSSPQPPAPGVAVPAGGPGAPPRAAPPQAAPPVAPAAPVGGPSVGAPPPRAGTTQPAPPPSGGPPPGAAGASDETQRIPPAP